VFGTFNTDYTPLDSVSFNPADRLFVIGNGSSSGFRSNAVTVMKSGDVGIGTDMPLTKLHVVSTDSFVALFENTQALAAGVQNAIYFKTGSGTFPYTGGIKTIGDGTDVARLSLFTYAAQAPSGLVERLSILDAGNAGFNTVYTDVTTTVQGLTGNARYFLVEKPTGENLLEVNSDDNINVLNNLNVVGTLSKGGGSFKIDHPLDPANKYLYHSFVESPDMMNVYNGNVTTNATGFATVELPDYFEALNRDFRYQLTVIGTFAQAIVKEKVKNNRFVIQTSEPNVEVSWQVTGIRQDPFANQQRIPETVEKPAGERGYYLHPSAFGLPAERGIGNLEKEKKEAFGAKK
jgi:hypothetical protein